MLREATKSGIQWITLNRLAYSDDCVAFNNLLDGAGNNVVNNIIMRVTRLLLRNIRGWGWVRRMQYAKDMSPVRNNPFLRTQTTNIHQKAFQQKHDKRKKNITTHFYSLTRFTSVYLDM